MFGRHNYSIHNIYNSRLLLFLSIQTDRQTDTTQRFIKFINPKNVSLTCKPSQHKTVNYKSQTNAKFIVIHVRTSNKKKNGFFTLENFICISDQITIFCSINNSKLQHNQNQLKRERRQMNLFYYMTE